MISSSLLYILWVTVSVKADWLPQNSGNSACVASKYSTFDGICNNVRHPKWGAAGSSFLRLLPPKYETEELPQNIKHIVSTIQHAIKPDHNRYITSILPLWAELIRHDIGIIKEDKVDIINAATSYLDASILYGNSVSEPAVDRLNNKAELDITTCKECKKSSSGVGALLTTLILEHNRLTEQLAKVNPHWPVEVRYLEARRIVIAELQHITFNEFLPTLLGEAVVTEWSLKPSKGGRFLGYSSSKHGGTYFNAVLAPLYVLSTMIPPTLISMRGTHPNKTNNEIEGNALSMLRLMINSPAQEPNLHEVSENDSAVKFIEFARKKKLSGLPDWINLCTGQNNHNYEKFQDLFTIQSEYQEKIAALYSKPSNIDLLVGGLLENKLRGSILGPTFSCILAHQFANIRESDRFWYENDIPPTSFSKDQLEEIRKVTLSGMFCSNMKGIHDIQPRIFLQEDPFLNSQIPCDQIPTIDLNVWQESTDYQKDITMDLIKEAVRRAEDDMQHRLQMEYMFYTEKGGIDPKSPAGTAAAFSKPNRNALLIANSSLLYEFASTELLNSLNNNAALKRRRRQLSDSGDNVITFGLDGPGKDVISELDVTSFIPPAPEDSCPEDAVPCNHRSPYRSYSGRCNNLERPNMGKTLTTFARLLPSVYENGISSPRQTSVTGVPLPSARLVSRTVHIDVSQLHSRYSLMMMQFAQFVDHDITFTPVNRGFHASIPDCRSCNSALTVHPECMPIQIPPGDPFYPQINSTTGERHCLPFMRSLPGQQRLGPREQINQNSAYLDGSQIYGDSVCLARDLRGYGGLLNATISPFNGKELLPTSPSHPECKAPSGYCFIAGDGRASEQPGLTSIHTIYMREHNRLVNGLRDVNPHWGDERLYQTARKINIAAYQHVLFNEFLPRILGWNAINLYGLKLSNQGYYKGYTSSCNPTVVTEFSSAAFRIGHSLLRPLLPRMSPKYTPVDPPVLLRDVFFNPDIINQRQMIDELIRGIVSTPVETIDQYITAEISNHLFENARVPHSGFDLPAMNIQRARDHGIPPYNEYRSLCNLKRAETWEDLSREIPNETIARFRHIYPSVNDIDLFPGGLSERPLQGGLVGPTFACIIGLQFRQLRKCDRFWYESDDPLFRFTEAQISEIRKTTLAKTLCNNLDVSSDIQRSALDQPNDFLNPRLSCHSLPSIDLNAWKETADQGCQIAGRTVPIGDSALPTPCTSCVCTPEGPQCASLRVTDCEQLLREAGRDAVLRDDVCAAQCSNALLNSPGPTLDALEVLVSLTTRRPPTQSQAGSNVRASREFIPTSLVPPPPPQTSFKRNTLRSFKIPDLAAFIG